MIDIDPICHSAAVDAGATVFWVANYKDGAQFCQFDIEREHSTEELDRPKLSSFDLYHISGRRLVRVDFQPGQCPLYRRRTVLRVGHGKQEVVHIAGWHQHGQAQLKFLYESDLRLEEGEFADRGLRCPIQFMEHDLIPVE